MNGTTLSARMLGVIFLFSGVSGLLYEVVWLRILIRVFGVTLDAVSTILTAYMAGLALGALLAGRLADRTRRPLAWYAGVEAGIGLCAALSTYAMMQLPEFLSRELDLTTMSPFGLLCVRLAASLAVLAPPTVLMGMTLPFLVRAATGTIEQVGHRASFLYGMNTLGAALGVAWAGFVSLGAWGESATVATGVGLNVLIALVTGLASRGSAALAPSSCVESTGSALQGAHPLPFPAVAALASLAGFYGLACETLWSRIMILFVGNSVYAFSSVLVIYLLGTALGSLLMRRRLDVLPDPSGAVVEVFAALAAWTLVGLYGVRLLGAYTQELRYLYSPLSSSGDAFVLLLSSIPVVAPVTLLLGGLFPLLVRMTVAEMGRLGSSLGGLYAANTVGAIAGTLAAGFVMVPVLGTRWSLAALAAAAVGAALAVKPRRILPPGQARRTRLWIGLAVLLGGGLTALPDPFLSVVQDRLANLEPGRVAFHREDRAGTVTAYSFEPARGMLLINGLIVSGTGGVGRMIFHLPFLFRDRPGRAFIVGLGVGEAACCALRNGLAVEVAELNPSVPEAFPIFHPEAPRLLADGLIEVSLADGRNRLLASRDKHGVIIVDASPPIFSSGVVNLYSREFFSLAASRLEPDGVMFLWVPLHCFPSDFWMISRGFLASFPHSAVFAYGGHAGIVLAGSRTPLDLDPSAVDRRIRERGLTKADPQLSSRLVTGGLVMQGDRLARIASAWPEVTDDRPRTEFPLGRLLAGDSFVEDHNFLIEAVRASTPAIAPGVDTPLPSPHVR